MDHVKEFETYLMNAFSRKTVAISESDLDMNESGDIELSGAIQKRLSPKIIDYYRGFNFHLRKWSFKENEGIKGCINIIPIKDSISDEAPEYLCGLRMLDYFIPEACIGYYLADPGEKPDDELYFLYFENEPQGLNVDMDGYVKLLYMTRGFSYWQETLLFLQGNPEGSKSSVEKFKTWMPKVFPDFKWDEFVALYEKVKLK